MLTEGKNGSKMSIELSHLSLEGKIMTERIEIVEKALLQMLEEKKYTSMRHMLVTMNPSDIAAIFDDMEDHQLPIVFRLLPKETAAETFVEMMPDSQELLIRGFSDNELKEVLDELYADDAADLVEEMPANVVKRILKTADPELRSSINQILRYPEYSAGSIMTTEYVSLRPNMTSVKTRGRPSAFFSGGS